MPRAESASHADCLLTVSRSVLLDRCARFRLPGYRQRWRGCGPRPGVGATASNSPYRATGPQPFSATFQARARPSVPTHRTASPGRGPTRASSALDQTRAYRRRPPGSASASARAFSLASFTLMAPSLHNAATTLPFARLRQGIPNILPKVTLGWRAVTASTTSSQISALCSPTSKPVPTRRTPSRMGVGKDSQAHGPYDPYLLFGY
jgi:hypothetical protein